MISRPSAARPCAATGRLVPAAAGRRTCLDPGGARSSSRGRGASTCPRSTQGDGQNGCSQQPDGADQRPPAGSPGHDAGPCTKESSARSRNNGPVTWQCAPRPPGIPETGGADPNERDCPDYGPIQDGSDCLPESSPPNRRRWTLRRTSTGPGPLTAQAVGRRDNRLGPRRRKRLDHGRNVAKAAAPLRILDIAGAAAGLHVGRDAPDRRRPPGLGDLTLQVGLANRGAVANGAVSDGLLLENGHCHLFAAECLAVTEVRDGARRRGAEPVSRCGQAGEGVGPQKRLGRDRIHRLSGLAALRATPGRGVPQRVDLAAVGHGQLIFRLSGSLTDAWNPVLETDSATFLGFVVAGS
jgi:hypothetical protein